MSVVLGVVASDGIAISGDGRTSWYSTTVANDTRKVWPLGAGMMCGITGAQGWCSRALAVLRKEIRQTVVGQDDLLRIATMLNAIDGDDSGAILLAPVESRIALYAGKNDTFTVITAHDVVGIGAGGEYATGVAAAYLKTTSWTCSRVAERAVAVACEFSQCCGGTIHTEVVRGTQPKKVKTILDNLDGINDGSLEWDPEEGSV